MARSDVLVATLLGIAYVVWLLGTARSLGFARDEGFYFSASIFRKRRRQNACLQIAIYFFDLQYCYTLCPHDQNFDHGIVWP